MDKNEHFRVLMQNRESDLYRIAFSYMRHETDAQDCVQDALIKGLESFDSLKDSAYFDTWIIRILINTCKDSLQRRKRILPLEREIDKAAASPEDKDALIDLLVSLDTLNDQERDLIVLRYFEGKKLKEISEEKDLKIGIVKSRLNRTLGKLRERMI